MSHGVNTRASCISGAYSVVISIKTNPTLQLRYPTALARLPFIPITLKLSLVVRSTVRSSSGTWTTQRVKKGTHWSISQVLMSIFTGSQSSRFFGCSRSSLAPLRRHAAWWVSQQMARFYCGQILWRTLDFPSKVMCSRKTLARMKKNLWWQVARACLTLLTRLEWTISSSLSVQKVVSSRKSSSQKRAIKVSEILCSLTLR